MQTRRSRCRRAGRHLTRAIAGLSAVMLVTSVWFTVDPGTDPASAAPLAGTARIVAPPDATNLLDSGGSGTDFAVQLPAGAACSGDSASDDYRVQSYMVPANVDPGTLTYGALGPLPEGMGADFRQPLYSAASGSPYVDAQTDINVGPAVGGLISGIPAFDFHVFGGVEGVAGSELVPEGSYNLGIACTLGPASPVQLDRYWNVEIAIEHDPGDEPGGFTWTVVSQQAATTTLALTVTPDASAPAGEEVTLTATVAPADAAGAVTFRDGPTELGAPVDVTGGVATLVTSTLAAGSHPLTAQFSPTDEAAYTSSSDDLEYLITADETTVTLTASPASTAVVGTSVQLKATVSPADAAGTVTFLDGPTTLNASPVPVAGGTATFTVDDLAEGEHSLTAAFTPTPDTGNTAATSSVLTYTITPADVTVTLAAAPTSQATEGEDVTVTATVAPASAAGSVTFLDGGKALGSAVKVSSGKAEVVVDDLSVGTHSLTASFTPDQGSGLKKATSTPLSYKIVAESGSESETVTVTLVADPASPATEGEAVTLTATVTPATAAGRIIFQDDGDALGGAVEMSGGKATFVVDDLAVGSHSLAAVFEAADGSGLDDATSAALTYDIVEEEVTAPNDPPAGGAAAGGPAGGTPLGSLPVTGGSWSIAIWGMLLVVAGRAAVLLGRPTRIIGADGP